MKRRFLWKCFRDDYRWFTIHTQVLAILMHPRKPGKGTLDLSNYHDSGNINIDC